MSEKYLISIAIGPVQDFIASARRSRDLWFGSWLLSELSKVVAEKITDSNGELIFPVNLDGSVANKILAIIDKPSDNFDDDLRKTVKDALKKIYEPIFKKIEDSLPKGKKIFYRTEGKAQINDLTEIYWAAVPFDESKDNYKICRERVEILLNARKATRNFKQVTPINGSKENPWASNAPKSSLDGQRESVIEDSAINDEKTEKRIQKIFKLRNKERLCGVGVLKRLGAEESAHKFLSTSHVASLSFIEKVGKENFEKYAKEIEKLAETDSGFNREDGQIIFQERLKDFVSETNLLTAKETLKNFLNKENPSPYFALLQADGDRMGTVIDYQDTSQKHKNLSKALSDFADKSVKEIVKNYNGCLIYSGGDDVLAMLPLHTVLDCTRELADEFAKKLDGFSDKDGNKPTLSAGIAVCHHTEPLQESLKTTRRAEKEAKKVKGKNALAIILSKRSGTDTIIKGSWKDDRNTSKSFDERLKWFIQLHLDEALPDGVAYELRDLWLRFRDDSGKIITGYEQLVEKEAIRILKRKDADNKILNELEKLIQHKDISLEDLSNEIIVARDFKRAYKQANKLAIGGKK